MPGCVLSGPRDCAARHGDILSAGKTLTNLIKLGAGMVAYMQSVSCQMHTGIPGKSEISVQQLEAKAWLHGLR